MDADREDETVATMGKIEGEIRVRLEPRPIPVLHCPVYFSPAMLDEIRKLWAEGYEEAYGKLLVLEAGMKLSLMGHERVMRAESLEELRAALEEEGYVINREGHEGHEEGTAAGAAMDDMDGMDDMDREKNGRDEFDEEWAEAEAAVDKMYEVDSVDG